ncbi:MAG: hypothetical protein ACI9R3_002680 [Verrucomicrobiales bacterium]|jgi:hypothetical protein
MASRFFTFLILCALALLLAQREESRGKRGLFDEAHLGWLHANSHVEHRTSDVLLVTLDDGDSARSERIFQSWPLSELDYALLLENLFQNHPRAVAIEPALAWPADNAPFLNSLTSRLQKIPSEKMLLGSLAEFSEFSAVSAEQPDEESTADEESPANPANSMGQMLARHVTLQHVSGQVSAVPNLTQFLSSPSAEVAGDISLAVTHIDLGDNIESPGDGTLRVPLLARIDERVIAAFPLAALMLHRDLDASEVTIELGKRITAPDLVIPIDHAGRFALDLDALQTLPTINAKLFALSISTTTSLSGESQSANDVITGLVESDADYAKVDLLQSHLTVIGQCDRGAHRFAIGDRRQGGGESDASLSRAEVFCQTIAAMDIGQQLIKAPDWSNYAIFGGTFLCMTILLCFKRSTALKGTLVVALILATTSLLTFQQWHVWFPAFSALVAIACATLAIVLVPRSHSHNHRAPAESVDQMAE